MLKYAACLFLPQFPLPQKMFNFKSKQVVVNFDCQLGAA